MAPLNPYLAYKRDTSRLIYLIVRASNAIIASSSTLPDDVPKTPNTNGQVTVSSLVVLSKLIARHISVVPPAILGLLDAVIQARTAAYETFRKLFANTTDPDIEQSNASHREFIVALGEAFEALGGLAWAEKGKSKPAGPNADDQANLEQVLFANSFSALRFDGGETPVEEDEWVSDNGSEPEPQQKRSTGKGKKQKSRKSTKKKDKVPVESYLIIQDEKEIVADYLMAVHALIWEWVELRAYLQDVWREVAYEGLNSAVAGAVSNIAIKMIERSAAAMFVYFPRQDSYETVMNTITRGDPEQTQGMFSTALHQISPDQTRHMKASEVHVAIKEQFLVHAYRDLVDFVTDFQKYRNGKPTKRMLEQLGNWDPELDLRHATEAERLKWRRCYTINWLYDLVNVFSSIAVRDNNTREKRFKLEDVDWSPSGPWDEYRRLFGLNEFAGVVTHLAMQKPSVDVRKKILPHHVFQLQCIVDSLTVSRGWTIDGFRGHIVEAPPPGFRPRRDVDLFLDREEERVGSGFLKAVDVLKQCFDKDAELNGNPHRHDANYAPLESLQLDFAEWLGESKYKHGLPDMPPSRFSATNSNGLWEYSPFLCGVGLAEGLVEAYRFSFTIMDKLPEPMLLVHLHNMLVQKGYIAEPVGLYESFAELFTNAFFADGEIPTSKFGEAINARVAVPSSSSRRGVAARSTVDDFKTRNFFFKTQSFLMSCEVAGWVPDRIPDADIPMPSCMATYRISRTERVVDPVTGKKRLKDTDLVKRARANGVSEEELIAMDASLSVAAAEGGQFTEGSLRSIIPEGFTMTDFPRRGGKREISSLDLLSLLKADLLNDICGEVPLSSLNYVWIMARFMGQFMKFEVALGKVRNHLYVQAYELNPRWRTQKRVGLAYVALQLQGEEECLRCLRVMAREFQNPRAGFMDHIYWDDLEDIQMVRARETEERLKKSQEPPGQCVIM